MFFRLPALLLLALTAYCVVDLQRPDEPPSLSKTQWILLVLVFPLVRRRRLPGGRAAPRPPRAPHGRPVDAGGLVHPCSGY